MYPKPLKTWQTSALAATAGIAQTLALAPFNWAPLAIIALLGWLITLRQRPIISSFFFGLGLFASGAHWVWVSIHQVANTPMALSAILWLSFILGLSLVYAFNGWIFSRLKALPLWLVFPALVVTSEVIRTYLFTGFPWLFVGYAAIETPFASLGAYVGVYGLTAMTALASVFILQRRWLALAPLIASAALPWPSTEKLGDPLSYALIQPNVPADKKWASDWRAEIIDRHLDQSLANPADLFVWSEAALPLLGSEADQFFTSFADAFPDSALVSGRLIAGPKDRLPRYYNALAGFGQAQGADYKTRLVPFGEYMPLEPWLRGLIDFFDLPLSTIIPGQSTQPLTLFGLKPGVMICYEVAYPGLAHQKSKSSSMLLSVSNDAWFGQSIARDQHLQMAQMRAIESGRPMLRATNDGVTAHIGSRGEILKSLPNQRVDTLTGQIQPRQGHTPYLWIGPYPALFVALLTLIYAGLTVPFRRRQR